MDQNGTKRRSSGPQIGGQVYSIGLIWANRAFVVIRGNLRLLYVARDYRNYAAVARRVFDHNGRRYDYDHVLRRKLCQRRGCDYILLSRLEKTANRSHGRLEPPKISDPKPWNGLLVLDKFCFANERIFFKMLGIPHQSLPTVSGVPGDEIIRAHKRDVTAVQSVRLRHALGMNGRRLDLTGLTPIR